MKSPKKQGSNLLASVLLAGVLFFVGFQMGQGSTPTQISGIDNITEGQPESVDFSAFWKAWSILEEKYVPAGTSTEAITNEQKLYGAIKGLASSLGDPYTVFFPPVESKLFESDIRGNFEGVGMEIVAQEGAITVIAPLRGSPAERAGLEPGDKIIKIDDSETVNLSTEEAVEIIRGPKGTPVTFAVFREGSENLLNVTVERDVINIPTIDTRVVSDDIFLIELYNFSAQSPNLFRNALREYVESGHDKLILDLRGNPGGYLEAAIDMASWFLPPGRAVVREDFGTGRTERVYRSKGYDIFNGDMKFVILVDGGSASASEILAGALSEYGKAVLVGDKTFGKGSVQELVNITPETSLKVTVARWLTPNGISISDGGITPDVLVKHTREDSEAGQDPQLEEAIRILSQ